MRSLTSGTCGDRELWWCDRKGGCRTLGATATRAVSSLHVSIACDDADRSPALRHTEVGLCVWCVWPSLPLA